MRLFVSHDGGEQLFQLDSVAHHAFGNVFAVDVIAALVSDVIGIGAAHFDWLKVRQHILRHVDSDAEAASAAARAAGAETHPVTIDDWKRECARLRKENSSLKLHVWKLENKLARNTSMYRKKWVTAKRKSDKAADLAKKIEEDRSEQAAKRLRRSDAPRSHFTTSGKMTLALKRCVSNAGAGCLGLTLGMDVHRTTVTRHEVDFRAALLAASRQFHRYCLASMVLSERQPGEWCCFLFYSRGDATNSQCWQRCKLRCHELDSAYITEPYSDESDYSTVMKSMQCRRTTGAIQVCGGGTGEACYAMVEKQTFTTGAAKLSVGLRAVAAIEDASEPGGHFAEGRNSVQRRACNSQE